MSTPIVPTLKGQCIAEFLGTALLIFFGTGCVAALKLGSADLGLWKSASSGASVFRWRCILPPAFPVLT